MPVLYYTQTIFCVAQSEAEAVCEQRWHNFLPLASLFYHAAPLGKVK